MRIEIERLGPDFAAGLAVIGSAIREASDASTEQTAKETLAQGRALIASTVSPRASQTLFLKQYVDREAPLVEYLGERWSRGGGNFVLGGMERANTIRGRRGQGLAIPLPSAGRFYSILDQASGSRTRQRVTPAIFEQKTGLELVPVKRPNGDTILFARDARLNRSGVARRVAGVRNRGRGRAAGTVQNIAVFVIKAQATIPQQFDFDPVRQFADRRLGELTVIELERREVI